MVTETLWCVCETYRRQSGYTRLNDENDYGCAVCRKPTKLYYERVVLPREQRGTTDANGRPGPGGHSADRDQ
jgi:hypothetical protein